MVAMVYAGTSLLKRPRLRSLTRPWISALSPGSPTQSLVFSLLTGTEPPASGAANPSLLYTVNAEAQPTDATAQAPQEALGQTPSGEAVVCQLEGADGILAQGLIRLQQAPPPRGDGSDQVLEGTLRLDYLRPSGSR